MKFELNGGTEKGWVAVKKFVKNNKYYLLR